MTAMLPIRDQNAHCSALRSANPLAGGFDVFVLEDTCRANDVEGSMLATRKTFNAIGVRRICAGAVG
jgi:hypothetical protein